MPLRGALLSRKSSRGMGMGFPIYQVDSSVDHGERRLGTMKQKLIVSYQEFSEMMALLTIHIKLRYPEINILYAPPRGGWPMAVHLSHHLQVPVIIGPNDTMTGRIPFALKHPGPNKILFVDDIVDSGWSLEGFHQTMRRCSANGWNISVLSCSLFVKPRASILPSVWRKTVPNDTWVVFPWERREDAETERSEYLGRQAGN